MKAGPLPGVKLCSHPAGRRITEGTTPVPNVQCQLYESALLLLMKYRQTVTQESGYMSWVLSTHIHKHRDISSSFNPVYPGLGPEPAPEVLDDLRGHLRMAKKGKVAAMEGALT